MAALTSSAAGTSASRYPQGQSSSIMPVSRALYSLPAGTLQLTSQSQSASKLVPSSGTQPSTPSRKQPSIDTPSPGLWKHPKFAEIARRQRKSTFDNQNVNLILWNLVGLAGFWILSSFSSGFMPVVFTNFCFGIVPSSIMVALVGYNIFNAFAPFIRGKDELLDIDLTASQRALLGLDPNATPPVTPTTKYITPPRYPRSSTPRSGTPGSRGSSQAGSPLNGSPLARNGSPSAYRDSLSPQATPPWQRKLGNGESRRHSYAFSTSSAVGTPPKDMSIFAPQTPSPTGRGSGIPISNKWIYHKRSSSSSRGMY